MTTPRYLIIPGWQDSGPQHWQTLWENNLGATRVVQKDWMNPKRADWVAALDTAIRAQPEPPILVAHSLGCIATAMLSEDCEIAGAFLVAPPDLEQESTPKEIQRFLPTPLQKLRFPSLLIASNNDPYCSIDRALQFAQAWGSQFINLGPQGHINTDAGFGTWQKGFELLQANSAEWQTRRTRLK